MGCARTQIWDNFSIFRKNCAILTSYIRADTRFHVSLSFVLRYYNNFHQRSPKDHHVCYFHIMKLYTAKIKWTRGFDSIESFQFDLIKSVIVTFLIISAVFTNFQLMLFKICSQTLINLKHIQKLDVRFHTKVRSPICQCSLAVQNTHRRAL